MKNWNQVKLVPEFNEQGVACYKLAGGNYVNEYYVVSEAETRKLLNTPEIVGYEEYDCLIPSTSQMLYYFKEQKKVTTANILSILRGRSVRRRHRSLRRYAACRKPPRPGRNPCPGGSS